MFDLIYGNTTLKELLIREITVDTFAHAYIIEGSEGSGKHTLAYEIAVALYEESVKRNGGSGVYEELLDEAPKSERHKILFRRFADAMSPDVSVKGVAGEKKSIGVDTVREIFDISNTTSNELDFKMIIVENADLQTISAQNAFLKLLEAPPHGVYFLLLCENSSLLLPTLRSRAALLRMEMFDDGTLLALFSPGGAEYISGMPGENELKRIIGNSEGTVGQVKKGIENLKKIKNSGNADSVTEMLELITERKSAPITVTVMKLPTERNELTVLLNQFGLALRDTLYVKSLLIKNSDKEVSLDDIEAKKTMTEEIPECKVKLLFFPDCESAYRYARALSMNEIITIYDKVNNAMNILKRNGNVRLALTGLSRDICRSIGIDKKA